MKLLVIEDELSLQEIMAVTLRKEGYVVETASSYSAAVDKIGVYSYDCVLLDITLPDGNVLSIVFFHWNVNVLPCRFRKLGIRHNFYSPHLCKKPKAQVTSWVSDFITAR